MTGDQTLRLVIRADGRRDDKVRRRLELRPLRRRRVAGHGTAAERRAVKALQAHVELDALERRRAQSRVRRGRHGAVNVAASVSAAARRGRREIGGVGSRWRVLAAAHAAGGRALAEELLLELGVPVVLDVVVGSPRQLRRDDRPPASMSVR